MARSTSRTPTHPATEIISELYVPRAALADFLAEAADDFRANGVDCIYGTIRLIERDDESFLAWAKQPYACTIFNLHTQHTPEGIEHSAAAFRRLIDMAARRSGSWFLTYHTFGTRCSCCDVIRSSRSSCGSSAATTLTSDSRANGTGTTSRCSSPLSDVTR